MPDAKPPAEPAEPARGPDPTEQSRWRPLRILLAAMDQDIAQLYEEQGLGEVRPLAADLDMTHSVMSQTVSTLRRKGLVRTVPGSDARTREVALTAKAREITPFLEAEWRATERAAAELEDEIPYALSQVVRDIEAALDRRSFHDRIVEILERSGELPS